MGYMKSKWVSQDKRFILEKKYHAHRLLPTEQKAKEKRGCRTGQITNKTQQEINKRIRQERINRQILDNFKTGDWYLTFTYAGSVPEAKVVQEDLKKLRRKLKAVYQRAKIGWKYISVVENLIGRGRAHAHMLLPKLPVELMEQVEKCWSAGHVKIEFFKGHAVDGYRLSSYFAKQEIENGNGRISTSRNLIRTEPKKEKVTSAQTWADEPKPPKGYHLVKELSYRTYTLDGYPMQKNVYERDDNFVQDTKRNKKDHRPGKKRQHADGKSNRYAPPKTEHAQV